MSISSETEQTKKDTQGLTLGFEEYFDFKDRFKDLDFKELLFKGYVTSGTIKVSNELEFECRTLLLEELIKCAEISSRYNSADAKSKAYMVEYLMYSILKINNSPLLMDFKEIQFWKEKYKREPTREEEARWILLNKVPPFLLEFLYVVAIKFKTDFDMIFIKEIEKQLREVMDERAKIVQGAT